MRNKLIAAGAGLFGYGVLWGWAIGADLADNRAKDRVDTLTDVVTRQADRLEYMQELLESIPMTEEELETISKTTASLPAEEEAAPDVSEPAAVVGTTPEGRVAYSDADEVVERPIPPGESPAETESNLRRIIDQYVKDEDEVHDFTSRVLAHENSDKSPPFVISQQVFALELDEEGEKFDKVVLTYYPHERVLVNDDEETEDDLEALIGWESLGSFGGDDHGDPDVVYVRNPRLRTDFEVVRETENKPPLHVLYGMDKQQFAVQRAAGVIRVRPEDE